MIFTPIGYLKHMLSEQNDFLQEYKKLHNDARDEMKEYATKEMNAKGITIQTAPLKGSK